MADGMSFDKYIDNPSGGSSVITNRNMYKEMYRSKFDRVLLRENGNIEWKAYYTDDKTDSYYIYMKIPSEVIDNFYYDVVVRLFTTENSKKSNTKLREYAVQFYSNDPAFVYTFAHSFKVNNLFIKDLESKMSRTALKNEAKIKNPKNEVWYVKSLYFAYLTMERYNLFNKTILRQRGSKYNKKELLNKITNADTKIEDRQKAQKDLDNKKRKEKEKQNKVRKDTELLSKKTKMSNISKTAKVSKISNKIKTTKTTKKTYMKKPSS